MEIGNIGDIKGEFHLFLQPKHSGKTGELIGAEALSRFISENGEIISPISYIEEFEKTGMIIELDFCILDKVCAFLKEKNQGIPVSVNFAKVTLESKDFISRFESIVNKYGINSNLIDIEITELNIFHDYNITKNEIDKLRSKGYKISIDDYGKNSSAFSIIRKIDVDTLKIDKEIISESEYSQKTLTIFKGVTDVAKKIGISVVAEGVETKKQLEIAKWVGCDVIQGWYFSKALCIGEFLEYANTYRTV